MISKRVGPATLELKRHGAGVYLNAEVSMNGSSWRGTASFPLVAQDEAVEWLDRVENPTDLEDLMREWSSAETWGSYQAFRARHGF